MLVQKELHNPYGVEAGEENNLSYDSILSEMQYLHDNYSREGLPHDWRFLNKTGFNVAGQVDMLYQALDSNNLRRKEIVNDWLRQTDEDTKGFIIEYLTQKLTFPIFYEIGTVDNQSAIIAPRYGYKRMVDLTSEKERNGVVKKTLEQKIEPFLLYAPDHSIAVMTSPDGWSGLTTQNGEPITFPDSQTYIFQKQQKQIVGFTIRTDFELPEHKEAIRLLGGSVPSSQDVCEFVSNTCFLNSQAFPGVDISDVVRLMQKARTVTTERFDAYKGRSWDEVYQDLQNRENLWRHDAVTQQIFDEYKSFVRSYPWTREELEEATAVMILRIARALGVEKKAQKQMSVTLSQQAFRTVLNINPLPILSYGSLLKVVEEKGGCAGGGSTSKKNILQSPIDALLESISPRLISIGSKSEKEKYSYDQPGPCRVCNEDVKCGPCQICKPCDERIQREQEAKNVLIEGIEMPITA